MIREKLGELIHQIYVDAEYRERVNIRLKDMVIELESRNEILEKQGYDGRQRNGSIRKYARMLENADNEKVALAGQIAELSRDNYQLTAQLSSHTQNPENEGIYKGLKLGLEHEKATNRVLVM